LRAFQLGDLSDPVLSTVAEHLDHCSACEHRARGLDSETDRILASIRDPSAVWGSLPSPAQHLDTLVGEGTADRQGRFASRFYPFLAPPVQQDEIGRLGNYRVLRLLGKGGMGYVFHAEDLALGRAVALKVMKPELGQDHESWQRFLREARLMAVLKHDHLATVYQAGQEGSVVYLAMELLQGESLLDWLKRRPSRDLAAILRLAREITSALAVIHARGLIHRDVKPANIWLEAPQQRVKLLDFGLARRLEEDTHLTQTGVVVGTPTFMSPEQARGESVDARTDLFSLGAVLYCLCTGTEPFRGPNVTAVLTALAVDTPRPVQDLEPRIPEALSDLVMELLAKRPQERPPSAEAVLERLQHIESGTPTPRPKSATVGHRMRLPQRLAGRRPVLVGLAMLLGLVAAGIGLAVMRWFSGPATPIISSAPASQPAVATRPAVPETERVYINSWKPVASRNWPLPLTPTGEAMPNPFLKISVDGQESPHGIGMHPSFDGPASLTFDLGKQYGTFQGKVSLNDSIDESDSPMIFSIRGDGELLWKSKPVSTSEDTQSFSVSVKGVDKLKLDVSARKKAHGAHGVWFEPFLAK